MLTDSEIRVKMEQLIGPVLATIQNCKTNEELLMLASVMISTSMEIMANAFGKPEAEKVLNEMLDMYKKEQ